MSPAVPTSITVALLVGCRGDKPAAPPPDPSPVDPPAKVIHREQPKLPDPVAPAQPALPRQDGLKSNTEAVFANETRDDDWAPKVEKELGKRFAKIRGAKLEDTECRHSQCRIVVHGSQAEV